MPTSPVANLPFYARVAAIARWEQRCARAGLRQAARYGDQWLREELASVMDECQDTSPARHPGRPTPRSSTLATHAERSLARPSRRQRP
jgi:hypothetical protein